MVTLVTQAFRGIAVIPVLVVTQAIVAIVVYQDIAGIPV